jgi:D-sedoheptulose 7-phosphate isomerase
VAVSTFSEYSQELNRLLSLIEVTADSGRRMSLEEAMECTILTILSKKSDNKKIIVIGNGGSAAIASHMQNDLCKACAVRSLVFNEAPLLSALANDLSYKVAFEFLVNLWAERGDVLIAISSSGQSENIILAADAARNKDCSVITFSGFKSNNPLRRKGLINFYIPIEHYGFVELGHSILTHYISDAAKNYIDTSVRN